MKALNYFIELNLALAVVVPAVWVCLRNQTAFAQVRAVLLAVVVICWVLPAIKLPAIKLAENLIPAHAAATFVPTLNEPIITASAKTTVEETPWLAIASGVYLAGVVWLLVRFALLRIRFFFINKSAGREQTRLRAGTHATPYAFLGYIFRVPQTSPSLQHRLSVTHEIWHVRLGHSYDLQLVEITRAFCWANPAVYLLRRFLREVHEFQADEKTAARFSREALEQVLIESTLGQSAPPLAQGMFTKPIFKRIHMIHATKKPISNGRLVALAIITLSAGMWLGCQDQIQSPMEGAIDLLPAQVPELVRQEFNRQRAANPESNFIVIDISSKEGKETLARISPNRIAEVIVVKKYSYAIIREKPQNTLPPGDDTVLSSADKPAQPLFGFDKFKTELSNLFLYPAGLKGSIEGKVFVEFIVNKDGTLSDHTLLQGIHPEIDAEVLRIMMLAQNWQPAEHQGKIVRMKMVVPVTIMNQEVKK